MKLNRNKKLLKVVCRDASEDTITYKYNWYTPDKNVPIMLVKAALAFLNLDIEKLKEAAAVVCETEEELRRDKKSETESK